MSIIISKIDETTLTRKWNDLYDGTLMHATIDPKTIHQSSLPSDYVFPKCCVTQSFKHFVDRINNFKIRSDDVWIVGHFKSGTTWMHNISWQLKNNLDSPKEPISITYHSFERPVMQAVLASSNNKLDSEKIKEFSQLFDQFDDLPSPRIFKSHLPAQLLPKELWTVRPKIIHIERNPKDIAVSGYNYFKNYGIMKNTENTMEDYFDACLRGYSLFGPVIDHALSFWQLRHLNHVLFSVYEEFLKDQFNGIKRVSEFLECSYDDEQLRNLTENVSFNKMKKDASSVTYKYSTSIYDERFYRKGKAGSYRDDMSDDYVRKFDEWITERLKNSVFKFADV